MLRVKNQIRRFMDRMQGRFQRSRAGSVLILVVVLLVLMALLGMAFLVTSRNDRYASKLYEHNVEIDMLLQGVENMAIATITADTTYQHPPMTASGPNVQPFDDWFTTPAQINPYNPNANPNAVNHSWLASRVPTAVQFALGNLPAGGFPRFPVPKGVVTQINGAGLYMSLMDNNMLSPTDAFPNPNPTIPALPNPPYPAPWAAVTGATPGLTSPIWPAITAPLLPGAIFEDPRATPAIPIPIDTVRFFLQPTFINLNGTNWPAFNYLVALQNPVSTPTANKWQGIFSPNYTPTTSNPSGNPFTAASSMPAIAASASGDGIADSFLWRLPVGTIDGVTYYAAVRIIDHNSAINVNTANSSSAEFTGTGAQDGTVLTSAATATSTGSGSGFGPGLFPSDIGLAETLAPYSITVPNGFNTNVGGKNYTTLSLELAALNQYRFNNQGLPAGIAGSSAPNNQPIDDTGTARTDFQYRNLHEAMWMGLGRRLDNWGYVTAGVPYYLNQQPLSWDQSATLAYRFSLINPNSSPSTIEELLVLSLYNSAGTPGNGILTNLNSPPVAGFPTYPYDPSGVNGWFNTIYAFGTGSNRRPYLTARNPINNCMPAHPLLMAPVTFPVTSQFNTYTQLNDAQMAPLVKYLGTGVTPTGVILPSDPTQPVSATNPPYDPQALVAKVSLNTADITAQDFPAAPKAPTLWYGFYNAMLDALQPQTVYSRIATSLTTATTVIPSPVQIDPTNLTIPASTHGARPYGGAQFRSSIRDVNATMGIGSPPAFLPTPLLTSAADYTTHVSAGALPPQTYLPGPSMVLLRSLLAAVNAADLRDSDDVPTAEVVQGIPATVSGNQNTTVTVQAFGLEKQPFITEVYANNYNGPPAACGYTATGTGSNPNPNGYVCVQLYNPYDTTLNIAGWTLNVVARNSTTYPRISYTTISTFPANTLIPPKCYLMLENYNVASPTTGTAPYRPFVSYPNYMTTVSTAQKAPWSIGGVITWPAVPVACNPQANATTNPNNLTTPGSCYVANLQSALGGELVLARPATTPGLVATALQAPADSFDFTGLQLVPATTTIFTAIHYVRINPGNPLTGTTAKLASPPANMWKFVYAGHWDAGPPPGGRQYPQKPFQVLVNSTQNTIQTFYPNQEGIAVSSWNTVTGSAHTKDQWTQIGGPLTVAGYPAYSAPIMLGLPTPTPSYVLPFAGTGIAFPAIQISNSDMGGTAKITGMAISPSTTGNVFPFGGFARVGDVLQVPFIGSYAIYDVNNNLLEWNPVTRDIAFADDNDGGNDDIVEQVGRLCPLIATEQTGLPLPLPVATDPALPPPPQPAANTPQATAPYDYYAWANHVPDCFTVLTNPYSEYTPNMVPYRTNTQTAVTPAPVAVTQNSSANATATVPRVDGLININTADVLALQSIPFLATNQQNYLLTGTVNWPISSTQSPLAVAIVQFRNTYGPFKSIFDLNKVNISGTATLQNSWGNPTTYDYDQRTGDLSGGYGTPYSTWSYSSDGVTNDFETRFAAINRVSNLLTTRSDTYTVYVLVQGWIGVGTSQAQMVAQRRAAFIIDRSSNTSKALNFSQYQIQTAN